MTFAKRFEDAPAVWGIGRLVVNGEVVPWPVSEDDVDDEAESMTPRLAALGLEPGGIVLIASMLSQAIHVVPLERAAGRCGALYSSADATPFDAFRVAALVRQLEPQVVMGITSGVLDGLEESGRDAAGVLASVPTVVSADDGAYARLRATGLTPRRWVRLGPTSAIESLGEDGPTFDTARWEVDEGDDGELVVTNRVRRLTPARRLRTGVQGRVVDDGRLAL